MTRNLSSSVIEKFNGYENIKQKLARKEKVDFIPLDIVYKPTFDGSTPIPCFFKSQIYLVYRRYLGQFKNGEEEISHLTVNNVTTARTFPQRKMKTCKSTCLLCKGRNKLRF